MASLACGSPTPYFWTEKQRNTLACSLFSIDTLTVALIIYLSYNAFKQGYNKNKPLMTNFTYFIGIFVCILTLLLFLFHYIRWASCLTDNIELAADLSIYSTAVFMIQGVMVIFYFFAQVYQVFVGTPYAISKPVLYCYAICWVFTVITCILRMYYMNTTEVESSYDWGVVYMTFILFLNLCIGALFLKKLFHVASTLASHSSTEISVSVDQKTKTNEDVFTPIITKYSILATISIITTTIDFFTFWLFFYGWVDPLEYLKLSVFTFYQIMGRIDPFTNFLAVVLTRKSLKSQYDGLFGWLDLRCRKCCGKYTSPQKQMAEMTVKSKTDLSSIDSDSNATCTQHSI